MRLMADGVGVGVEASSDTLRAPPVGTDTEGGPREMKCCTRETWESGEQNFPMYSERTLFLVHCLTPQ